MKECRQCKQSAATTYVQDVRHEVYVRCLTNQSAAIAYVTGCTYAVQPIRARLWRTSRGVRTLFVQSELGYSVRHGVYVRFLTNQSAAMAYVTGCTYAFRPISARRSRILISVAPCGGLRNLAQPHAASKIRVDRPLYYYSKYYIGMTSNTFKERYRNHIKSFTHKIYSNETEFSKHVWHLKQNKTDFTIKWSIIKKSISYTGGSKRCNLCLEEKLLEEKVF